MDLPSLAEELGLEVADVRRLVLTFAEATEGDLMRLELAFTDRDVEQLRRTAHHIKGAASNLEFTEIAAAALAIEDKARSGILEDPANSIARIRGELNSIRIQLHNGE
ncbi:MAG: Hpt domain-containing protein [Spirochaetaceae bacterium]|nr:MAG: Hpt domain-containing protein [Spirochaetaceae bacterium]